MTAYFKAYYRDPTTDHFPFAGRHGEIDVPIFHRTGWYDRFVPCGIADAGVTSLSTELGRDVTVTDVLPSVRRHLSAYLAWQPYDATPDYEPRPEPGHGPRIQLVTPGR